MEDNIDSYIHIAEIASDWLIYAINKTLKESCFKLMKRNHGAFSDRLICYKSELTEEEAISFKENIIKQLLEKECFNLWKKNHRCLINYNTITYAWNESVIDPNEIGYIYYPNWYPNVQKIEIINEKHIIVTDMAGKLSLVYSPEFELNDMPNNSR